MCPPLRGESGAPGPAPGSLPVPQERAAEQRAVLRRHRARPCRQQQELPGGPRACRGGLGLCLVQDPAGCGQRSARYLSQ